MASERTIQVTLTLPAELLTNFHAAQSARQAQRLSWQTLEEYLVQQILDQELRASQERQAKEARGKRVVNARPIGR